MSFYGISGTKNKRFTTSIKSVGGRNNSGSITVRHRGKKFKNTFFYLDHKRTWTSLSAIVLKLNLNKKKSFCALIKYLNGSISYISAPFGLFPGNIVKTFNPTFLFKRKWTYNIGDQVNLFNLKINSIFFNLLIKNLPTPTLSTSPGTYCKIIYQVPNKNLTYIRIPSGKKLFISNKIAVTIGRNSNIFWNRLVIGKAGKNRLDGYRPTVRGVAMNPVDHPHGGRTKTNQPEVTPWSKIAKKQK